MRCLDEGTRFVSPQGASETAMTLPYQFDFFIAPKANSSGTRSAVFKPRELGLPRPHCQVRPI